MSLDPLAADYPSWSDYNYVLGNPIRLVDSDGKSPENPSFYLKIKVTIQQKQYEYPVAKGTPFSGDVTSYTSQPNQYSKEPKIVNVGGFIINIPMLQNNDGTYKLDYRGDQVGSESGSDLSGTFKQIGGKVNARAVGIIRGVDSGNGKIFGVDFTMGLSTGDTNIGLSVSSPPIKGMTFAIKKDIVIKSDLAIAKFGMHVYDDNVGGTYLGVTIKGLNKNENITLNGTEYMVKTEVKPSSGGIEGNTPPQYLEVSTKHIHSSGRPLDE